VVNKLAKTTNGVVQAEFESLELYLGAFTNDGGHIALLSFNHWQFAIDALTETAVTAHDLGATVTIGLWADDLPMRDTGWTTDRRIAKVLGSPGIDSTAMNALVHYGVPEESFVRPPVRNWKPQPTVAPPTRMVRSEIRKWNYREAHMGRSILQVHPDSNTPIREDLLWPRKWVEQSAKSFMWVFDQTTKLIQEQGVTALVLYNGRFTHDQAAAAAAKSLGVTVLYYDAGGLDTGFDLTTGSTHDWEHLQLRMKAMAESWEKDAVLELGTQWFLNRQSHTEAGIQLFVGLQQHGNTGELPEAEKLIVFFSSSGDEIAELDLNWDRFFNSQQNALKVLSTVCQESLQTKLVVRTHPHMRIKPKQDLADWVKAVDSANVDLHIGPESTVDSYELMRKADVVVTYGSTSGVEAAFIGKPVIVMGPSAYNKLGCALEVFTTDQLEAAIANPPEPNSAAALPYGLMMQRRGFNYTRIRKTDQGTSALGGQEIRPTKELVRKLSYALAARKTKKLLGNYNRG